MEEFVAAVHKRIVLTSEEVRVIVFVGIAIVIGLTARYYRDTRWSKPGKIDNGKQLRARALIDPSATPTSMKRARIK